MSERKYIKLKDLVGNTMTIKAVPRFVYKKWDDEAGKMEISDIYKEGFRKLYLVETDKGNLDMGTGQIGNLLSAAFYQGKSDLIGKTFQVKSNGKEGKDIRYFFNLAMPEHVQEQVNLEELPF